MRRLQNGCLAILVLLLLSGAGGVQNLSDLVRVYRKHHSTYKCLIERIAATDALIDQIVYRLYGLTEEESAVVEGEEQT